MKKAILLISFIASTLCVQAQPVKDTAPAGSVELALYQGRTACAALDASMKIPYREQCAKRKLSLVLYVDSVTRQPTLYRIGGAGIRSGEGTWAIEKGMPAAPDAVVYRLHMGEANLLLLKGGEQVLFILDEEKQFLVGNAKYSYTLNRVSDKRSMQNWRQLVHRGASF